MAAASSFSTFSLFLCISSVLLLLFVVPAKSANCSALTFSKGRNFTSCADLATLGATLHWTYHTSNSSLAFAFVAAPVKSGGWTAWGINPTDLKMIGTQALIAYKHSNGSLVVNTYNISSFEVKPSKILYPVSRLSAESKSGSFVIYATLELPKGTTTINQVWQVGAAVKGDVLEKHEMGPANLNAVGKLDLVNGASAPSVPLAPGTIPAPGTTPSPKTSSSPVGSPPSSARRNAYSTVGSVFWFLAMVGFFNLLH